MAEAILEFGADLGNEVDRIDGLALVVGIISSLIAVIWFVLFLADKFKK